MSAPPLPGLATPARRAAVLATLAAAALLALGASLAVGSIDVSASAIVRALAGDTSDTASAIVRELRLPRALAAFAVGALLALAGALMQVLLRNPLADPYILGISGGAAAGALGAMLAGAASVVTPAALGGALASTVLVFALARTGVDRAPWTTTRLLLTGVVVAAGWGALIALMLTWRPTRVKGMLFWLIGDLGGTTLATPRHRSRWRFGLRAPVTWTCSRAGADRCSARRRSGAHDVRACTPRWHDGRGGHDRGSVRFVGLVALTRFASSSATTSACCCPRPWWRAARCSSSRTRLRGPSSRRCNFPSA
jgi:hypothetical protein